MTNNTTTITIEKKSETTTLWGERRKIFVISLPTVMAWRFTDDGGELKSSIKERLDLLPGVNDYETLVTNALTIEFCSEVGPLLSDEEIKAQVQALFAECL